MKNEKTVPIILIYKPKHSKSVFLKKVLQNVKKGDIMTYNFMNGGHFFMKCTFCGAELNDGAMFCTECGKGINTDPAENMDAPVKAKKKAGTGLGIFSLLLGLFALVFPVLAIPGFLFGFIVGGNPIIIGIIYLIVIVVNVLGIVFGLLSLILAIVGMKKAKKAGCKNIAAVLGLIVALASVALWAVAIVLVVLAFIVQMVAGFFLPMI